MALPIFQRTVTDDTGNIVVGATVTVKYESTGLVASIFSDRAGSSGLDNPFTTGADGLASFYTEPGEYRIEVESGAFTLTWRYEVLEGDIATKAVVDFSVKVASVSDLASATLSEGQAVELIGYHEDTTVGGGSGVVAIARHNGGTAISLTRAFPTDWTNQTQLEAWFADSESDELCFVRSSSDTVLVDYFGGGDLATKQAINSSPRTVVLSSGLTTLNNYESGAFSAAICLKNLSDITIVGKDTTLMAGTGGDGELAFAMFRLEGCNNIKFKDFTIEGDYTNHSGLGASRSGGFYISSMNRLSFVDEEPNNDILIENIVCNDIGGFVKGLSHSGGISPSNTGIVIKRCRGTDAAQADNTIGFRNVIGAEVSYNNFSNTVVEDPYGSMFIDVSSGCKNVSVNNNIGLRYVFGAKSESSETYGASEDVTFKDNQFLETGHPTLLVVGEGDSAGGTYGLKLNSKTALASGNRITVRSGVGLSSGIFPRHTFDDECLIVVDGNYIDAGTQNGIPHSTLYSTGKYIITNNTVIEPLVNGVTMGANCSVSFNNFKKCPRGVEIQKAINNSLTDNEFIDCGTPTDAVVLQYESGETLGYLKIDNNTITDSRGVLAATNGYQLNCSKFSHFDINAGATIGLQGSVYVSQYTNSTIDTNDVFFSISGNPAAGSFTAGYNIDYVEIHDTVYFRIHFIRKMPATVQYNLLDNNVPNRKWQPFGGGDNYVDFRYVDATTGVVQSLPASISISGTITAL